MKQINQDCTWSTPVLGETCTGNSKQKIKLVKLTVVIMCSY